MSGRSERAESLCDFKPKNERWHCVRPRLHRGEHSPFIIDTINADGPARCDHERLNEDGICRRCGQDCRGSIR